MQRNCNSCEPTEIKGEEAIAKLHEDLTRDLYELFASHREEITRLMEEFDAHDIDTFVKLDGYERSR